MVILQLQPKTYKKLSYEYNRKWHFEFRVTSFHFWRGPKSYRATPSRRRYPKNAKKCLKAYFCTIFQPHKIRGVSDVNTNKSTSEQIMGIHNSNHELNEKFICGKWCSNTEFQLLSKPHLRSVNRLSPMLNWLMVLYLVSNLESYFLTGS